MKRLILKKLILISLKEAKSLEVPFQTGLNIIIGNNKTGKSSIIKSIFTTMGCKCPKVEKEWSNLISTYILSLEIGNIEYYVMRQGDHYALYEHNETEEDKCLIYTEHLHVFSNAFMEIMGVDCPCIDKYGNEYNIIPPLLFRFQYIDQDEGWSKIACAFLNMQHIPSWKSITNKYVTGYQGEEYFKIKREIKKKEDEIREKSEEYNHNKEFVTQIESRMQSDLTVSPEEAQSTINTLLDEIDTSRERIFDLTRKLHILDNEIFVNTKNLKSARMHKVHYKKDAQFAMQQGDVLICPVCGAHYHNDITAQLQITSQYSNAENLVNYLTQQISCKKQEQDSLAAKIEELKREISEKEHIISSLQEKIHYKDYLIGESKKELFSTCQSQLDLLKADIEGLIGEKGVLNSQAQEFTSRKRHKEITTEIKSKCSEIAKQINITPEIIKLKDFVQEVDKSGSETSRIVYMYHVALYLYNLGRGESPFNFLVIDTPNQQGQDSKNLQCIFDSLAVLNGENGQVIVGTERETGCESIAKNVVHLTDYKACLKKKDYSTHLELAQKLEKLHIQWEHDRYLEQKCSN